ncbi:YmfQ family protein [Citrobacter braakii]|uniref:YmfQ family protein n=1 Tax=Citrobacter braakii TaxID=57706 RepID=UPI00403A246B
MAMTSADYQRALIKLLPRGLAWPQNADDTLAKLLLALADGFAREDEQAETLARRESMPGTSQTLLDNWESFLGLPECGEISDTLEQRRTAAQAKFTMAASLNLNFLEELALGFGYDINIEQRYPHNCMRSCMYPLIPQEVRFTAYVTVNSYVDKHNATCLDDCMTPLVVYESGALECLLERYGPAYETFVYFYPESED